MSTGPGLADRWPLPDHDDLRAELLAAWDRDGYHDLLHLTEVLDRLDAMSTAGAGFDATTVRLAAWFHDAVYLPDRSENEERSARLAERALAEAGVSDAKTAEVARLVRLTVTHDPADDDPDGQVLCDADLAILASPPSAYAAYTTAVREEYHFVPSDAFREGRAAILRQLLDLPRLFRTSHGTAEWEATARYNLTAELEMLSPPPDDAS